MEITRLCGIVINGFLGMGLTNENERDILERTQFLFLQGWATCRIVAQKCDTGIKCATGPKKRELAHFCTLTNQNATLGTRYRYWKMLET